jgi:hypothetical protein
MKKFTFLFLLLLNFTLVRSQNNSLSNSTDTTILSDADEIPEFPGGDSVLLNFITTHFNSYKITLPKETALCTVNFRFIVTDSGKVEKIKLTEAPEISHEFAKDIINILELMPNWKPATNNSKAVNFLYFMGLTIFNETTTYRETKFRQYDSIKLHFNLINISKINHNKAKEDFYYNSGVKKSQMKDYQGAIDDFTEALKYNSKDIDALYNRALLKLTLNDLTGACADWNLIKKLEKPDADEFIKKYCN